MSNKKKIKTGATPAASKPKHVLVSTPFLDEPVEVRNLAYPNRTMTTCLVAMQQTDDEMTVGLMTYDLAEAAGADPDAWDVEELTQFFKAWNEASGVKPGESAGSAG